MVDGVAVAGIDDLMRLLDADRIGRAVPLQVVRRGSVETVELVPSVRPSATS
jgi:hypothetical protein